MNNCSITTARPPIALRPTSTMLSKTCLARNAQQAARRSGAQALQRRAFAAAASSNSASFETSDVSGLKVASRDLHGPTTKLAVVAKAGTRFQPLPGLSAGLAEFAFKVGHLLNRRDQETQLTAPSCTEHPTSLCPSHPARI